MRNLKYLTFLLPEKPEYSIKGVGLKTGFLILLGHLFFDNVGFSFNQSNPELIQRYPLQHPITPPIVRPHKLTEPEEAEKEAKYFDEVMWTLQKHRQVSREQGSMHPQMETDQIITESLYAQEHERVIEEAKNEMKIKLREKKVQLLDGNAHRIKDNYLLNKLEAKIKPLPQN